MQILVALHDSAAGSDRTPAPRPASLPSQLQQRSDLRNLYARILAIVPLVGTGSYADPKRPLYAPRPADLNPASRAGILAYSQVISDDGNFALVEFVAADKSAFNTILSDVSIKTFQRGKDKLTDIQTIFKQYRKDFDFSKFGVRMP